jgi:hypothetical protein
MDNEEKKNTRAGDDSEPYSFSDEVTKNKMKKHIHDIKDVITEQDIANVKIPGEEDSLPALPEEKKSGIPVEGKPVTPWDVID